MRKFKKKFRIISFTVKTLEKYLLQVSHTKKEIFI